MDIAISEITPSLLNPFCCSRRRRRRRNKLRLLYFAVTKEGKKAGRIDLDFHRRRE